MLDAERAVLADELFRIGAVEFGSFKLKAHEANRNLPDSPIFFTLRTPDNLSKGKPGPLTPAVLERLGRMLFREYQRRELLFDHISGIPKAGEPLAEAMVEIGQQTESLSLLKLGKETRPDGTRRILGVSEGNYGQGDVLLLIDDLISQGNTKFEAIEASRADGLVVQDLLVVIDREQGGESALGGRGCKLHSIFTINELIDHYLARGKVSWSKAQDIRSYLKAEPSS